MRLSRPLAFALQASIIVSFLAGSSVPTPLYALYQARWGFSPIMTTVVFGIYALAVLVTLLVTGRLSDHVGRRPVILVAAAMQAVTMAIFVLADGVGHLVLARVVQGIATGMAASAVGAGMVDIDREKGTLANSALPPLGTATGGILGGLFAHLLPAPTTTVYVFLGVVFVLQLVGVLLMPETVTPQAGALASLRPQLGIPDRLRRPLLLVAPALVGAWALAGFHGALGPMLLRRLMGAPSLALSGSVLGVLASSGAITVLLTRRWDAVRTITVGTGLLGGGVAATLLAIAQQSVAGFFLATAVAGAGFGSAYQGAVRSVLPLAAAHERAGVLSVIYVIAYLAMGVPAVAAGIGCVHGGGVIVTSWIYGGAVIALALVTGAAARSAPRSSGGRGESSPSPAPSPRSTSPTS